MKALLLKGPRQLEFVELEHPDLGPGQVRVRVAKVGICGSDYSSIAGKLPFTRFPIVPGHEASGEVTEAAPGCGWQPGERVLIHPILCDRGDPAFARGEVHHSNTTEVLGVVSRNGAYAEEVVVEDYMLRRVPENMDYEAAAMVEPVAVAARAVGRGSLRKGDRVLVFGAGNIGLLLVQVARALGASCVWVTDLVPERLALARELGADEALDAREPFPAELEKPFDVAIDGVATEETVRNALTACARGGRVVVYGVPAGEIRFPFRAAFAKDVQLITSRLYDADFTGALRLVSEGAVRVKAIITHRIRLDEAPTLISRVLDGEEKPIKVMMTP
jgi:L-gulonate 5-dehydrogenase